MHPLGRLIAQRMDHPDHAWSVRDVERRAREQGESLNKSTVSDLRKKMPPSITRSNVFGLAAGLGVTPLTVANAALESWGIETRPVEVTDTLATIAVDPTLSERDRRQLRSIITDMRAEQTAKGSDDHHLPPGTASSPAPSGAPDEARKDQEVRQYTVLRYDPDRPDVIGQGPFIEAIDDDDARAQIRRSLEVAGPAIDPRSDRTITVSRRGAAFTLIGLVREDAEPDREVQMIAKLRERGAQLMQDDEVDGRESSTESSAQSRRRETAEAIHDQFRRAASARSGERGEDPPRLGK